MEKTSTSRVCAEGITILTMLGLSLGIGRYNKTSLGSVLDARNPEATPAPAPAKVLGGRFRPR